MLETGTICDPDAASQPNNGCSWYHCQAESLEEEDDPSCQCEYQIKSGNCAASLRTIGLQDKGNSSQQIWLQLQKSLLASNQTLNLGNSSDQLLQPYDMEDWSQATNFIMPHSVSVLEETPQSACWEFRCFCGGVRCKAQEDTTSTSWSPLGSFPAPTSDATMPGSIGAGNEATLYMAWGLKRFGSFAKFSDEDARQLFQAAPPDERSLEISDVQYQRDMLAACEGTPPDMEIVSRSCFMKDFRDWLVNRYEGHLFPVPSEDFYARLQEFAEDQKYVPRADRKKYFWLSTDGSLVGSIASYRVVLQEDADPRERFEDYAREECRLFQHKRPHAKDAGSWLISNGDTVRYWWPQADGELIDEDITGCGLWIAGDRTAEEAEQRFILYAARSIAGYCSILVGLAGWILTCSPTLALVAAASLGYFVLVFMVYGAAFSLTQVGIIELLAVLASTSTSVLPVLRAITLYSYSKNGPSKRAQKAEMEPTFDFSDYEEPHTEPLPSQEFMDGFEVGFSSIAAPEEVHRELEEQKFRHRRIEAEKKMKAILQYFNIDTLRSEKKNRVCFTLRHGAPIFLAMALNNAMSWLYLILLAPPGLKEVRNTFALAVFSVPLLGLCLLPIIILHGASPSRVWTKAFYNWLGLVTRSRWRFGDPLPAEEHDRASEILLCAEVLGRPFRWFNGHWKVRLRSQMVVRRLPR